MEINLKNRLKSLIIIVIILLVPIGTVFSWPSFFQQYGPSHSSGCHGDGGPGTPSIAGGKIQLNASKQSVKAGEVFTVDAKITGFTEANGLDVLLGFLENEADNSKFIITPDPPPHPVPITSGSSATETFNVTAPLKTGDYTLKAIALYGGESPPGNEFIVASGSLDIFVGINLPTSYISVANYLVNTAENLTIDNNVGYRWEEYNGSATYSVGWGNGVAGVGDFLIETYNNSGKVDTTYLNYSEGAARWLWSIRHSDGKGVYWSNKYNSTNNPVDVKNSTGIFNGSAGIGLFFVKLYKQTGNATYLEWAKKIAQYLKNEDEEADPNKMAWSQDDSESIISHKYIEGTPGIGVFFMDLEQATSNITYGWWALNVSRYLINAADTSGTGVSWNSTSMSSTKIVGLWKGSAGIGNFLLDIYMKYGNDTAYEYANKTFDWINSVKMSSQGGYIWDHIIGNGKIHIGFDKGVAGISTFLYRLANITGNATHLAVAQGALNFLNNTKTVESGFYWWNASNDNQFQYSGKNNGMAGIGEAFLFSLNYTNNATYADMVNGIYAWYKFQVLRDDLNDSYSTVWRQSTKPSLINNRYSGIEDGAAGAGFFLLKRAQFLNDTLPPISGYLKTPIVSGTTVTFNVTNAVDNESGIGKVAFYISGLPDPLVKNETIGITNLDAGTYTVYAIIFDEIGNPLKTNSTLFTVTAVPTFLEEDGGGSRDLWKEPDILIYFYYGAIFTIIGVVAIILLTKIRFRHVSYSKPKRK